MGNKSTKNKRHSRSLQTSKKQHPSPIQKRRQESSDPSSVGIAAMMESIERMACNPDVCVEKMNGILDLQERVLDKNAHMQFNVDMSEMQCKMPTIKKDGSVSYKDKQTGKEEEAFKFATFENIMSSVKPVLSSHGFSIRFDSKEREGGGAIITCILSHVMGHTEEVQFSGALDTSGGKNNIQAMGSTFTYGKRYCLIAMLNIVTEGEDDDANTIPLRDINQKQFEEIMLLIEDTETNIVAFCGHLEISSIKQMPNEMYGKAISDLLDKKRRIEIMQETN